MSIKDLYIRSYRKYKLYAERHGIEVKIKPVKRPTKASIKRVEEEHKKNKVMQSTYRWIERVKINKRKKEREKKKIEKGFKKAKSLVKRNERKIKKEEKQQKQKKKNAPVISIGSDEFVNSVLDEIDTVTMYWLGAYARGNGSSLVDEKIQRLNELKTAIESVPIDEMGKILRRTTAGGLLVYDEIMNYIHSIDDYASGQNEEMKEESAHALWLLHWYSDDEVIKKRLEKSARRTETFSNGLRPGKTILEGKVEDFF